MENLIFWGFVWLAVIYGVSVFIGFYSSKYSKTLEGYMVAERKVHPAFVTASFIVTWMSAAVFVGTAGLIYYLGNSILWTEGCYVLGLAVSLLVVAPKLRYLSERFKAMTIPETVGKMYNSEAVRVIGGLIIVIFMFVMMIAQYKGGGIIFKTLGLSYEWGVVASAAVMICYIATGGVLSTILADSAMAIMIILGVVPLAIGAVITAGGFGNMVNAMATDPLGIELAKKLGREGSNLIYLLSSPKLLDIRPGIGEVCFLGALGWFAMAFIGTMGLPHALGRYLAVRKLDKRTYRQMALWSAFWGIILVTSIVIISFSTRTIIGPELAQKGPRVMDQAIGIVTQKVFVGHPWFVGYVLVAILMGIITTTNTLLVMIATSAARDVIQPIWKKVTDKQVVLWSRILTVVAGVVTAYFGIVKPPDLLMLLSNMSWAVMGYTFFCILTIGMYWKSANKYGAIAAAITSGLVFIILRMILNWPLGVVSFLGWVIVTAVFIIVSASTKSISRRVDLPGID